MSAKHFMVSKLLLVTLKIGKQRFVSESFTRWQR